MKYFRPTSSVKMQVVSKVSEAFCIPVIRGSCDDWREQVEQGTVLLELLWLLIKHAYTNSIVTYLMPERASLYISYYVQFYVMWTFF
jgi:hypothetical protein